MSDDTTASGAPPEPQGGISPPQEGEEWLLLGGTTARLRAWCESTFAWDNYDPPGAFVPVHVHPTQDEFIYVVEGKLEVELAGRRQVATPGSLMQMPRGVPHGYVNAFDEPTHCLFWVSPARKLKQLFDAVHGLTDVPDMVRIAAEHEVHFLPMEGEGDDRA